MLGIRLGRNGCMMREQMIQISCFLSKWRLRCIARVHSHGSAFCIGSIADVRLCTTFSTPCIHRMCQLSFYGPAHDLNVNIPHRQDACPKVGQPSRSGPHLNV